MNEQEKERLELAVERAIAKRKEKVAPKEISTVSTPIKKHGGGPKRVDFSGFDLFMTHTQSQKDCMEQSEVIEIIMAKFNCGYGSAFYRLKSFLRTHPHYKEAWTTTTRYKVLLNTRYI